MHIVRYLLIILVLTVVACASQPDRWFYGTWTITNATFAPVSAMSMDEAEQWCGKQLHYHSWQVHFETEQCSQPSFNVEKLSAVDFYRMYRMSFEALQISGAEVEVLTVGCPRRWTSPGATLIKVDDTTGYIQWDGIFFKVIRTAP